MITTFYHGTVAAFLPQIKKEGLKPEAKHAWKIRFDPDGDGAHMVTPDPVDPGVYLTKSKSHAEAYAQTRADYFERKPGECFMMYGSSVEQGLLFLSKDPDAPVLHTTPVLLTVEFDDDDIPTEIDIEDFRAVIVHKPLPPTTIKQADVLDRKYDSTKFTAAVRKKLVVKATDIALHNLLGMYR